ncbi:MAG: cysteine desulfurase [Gammaproteobacteria bacterium]|nr:cysteine desulfurase [Gammaproteobacteria bacterium]
MPATLHDMNLATQWHSAVSKHDFPLLHSSALGRNLHYLDNAATSHKPKAVIDTINTAYSELYSPIHRGLYPLAEAATEAYEQARLSLQAFIGASAADELIFTRSATESINLVAQGWARDRLQAGDQVWVSRMEHHANYLPWQRICQEKGAELKIIELTADGQLDLARAEDLYGPRSRLIALCQISNVLGNENPIQQVCANAQAQGIPVLVDAAQSVSHLPLNVVELGCDFLAFSAHKMYGPNGIGLLYARAERLQEMQPLLVGGGMVDEVGEGIAASSWIDGPGRFEAGSQNMPGALGFAAAADFIESLGRERIHQHLQQLTRHARTLLGQIPGIRLLTYDSVPLSSIVSFTLDGVHPHDLAQVAGERQVAIRAGHHCAQPLLRSLDLDATARASFAVYNDRSDVEALAEAIDYARRLFG